MSTSGNKSFIRRVSGDVLRISGAVGLAQLIVFAASPLLTRLYAPDAFGHFALMGALVTILTPLASLRYGWALPLPKEDSEARDVLALCLVVISGTAVLAGVMGVAAWATLSGWVDIHLRDVMLLAGALMAMGLNEVSTSWLVRHQAFRQVARVRFTTLVGMAVCQIALGMLAPSAASLMLGFIGGYFMGFLWAAYHSRDALAESVHRMKPRRLFRTAVAYRRFPLMTAPTGVLNGIGSQLSLMVLPLLYGYAVAGFFSLAHRVLWQPMSLIGQAANQVLWGTAARLQHENPKRLWLLFLALNAGLLAAMTPALLLVWYGEAIFGFVFGAEWAESGRYAGVIVVGSVVGLAAMGTTSLHIYGLNHWMSLWEVARLAVVGGALALAWYLELSPMGCVIALTAATAVMSTALLALNTLAVWRIRTRAERGHAAPVPDDSGPMISPRSSA